MTRMSMQAVTPTSKGVLPVGIEASMSTGNELRTNWVRSVDRLAGRALLRADHFPHLRCEIAIDDILDVLDVMSAPNVVLSGSHSRNVPALEKAKFGLLDILSSHYVPPSLLAAPFDLVRKAGWTLPRAMCTISSTPAKAVG